MDTDQRLLALKKAYADIILNTSKEAAARVMASERKAQRLQHELQVTKEEAHRMMLRLKKMMDDKVNETKMTSQNQQEKIDELEAQLQEAEDIVSELREELRYVQDKYERMTKNDLQQLDKVENAATEEAFEKNNRQYDSQFIPCPLETQKEYLGVPEKENSYMNERTEHPTGFSEPVQVRNSYDTKPELPSIILRRKEHKFYKNGCTQRIHACERNNLDGMLSLTRELNDVSSNKKVEEEKKDRSACKATNDEVPKDKVFNIESKEAPCKDGNIGCRDEVRAITLNLKKRKTATKYRNKKRASGKKIPNKLFRKIDGTPGVSHSDPTPNSVSANTQPNEYPTLIARKLSSGKTIIATHPVCAKIAKMDDNDEEGGIKKLIPKGTPPIMSMPFTQEGTSTESPNVQVHASNIKKVNKPCLHSELKNSGATSKGHKHAIKYTFQRKRKRESVSISDGNGSAENRTTERKKKQNISAEPGKSSLAAESSIEGKRLAQVALQLISLKGRNYRLL